VSKVKSAVGPTAPIDKRKCVRLNLPSVQAYRCDGWTALGDPTRRAIFELVADRPRAVGELAREFPVSRPAVSQHLKVLKDARLVVDQRAGNRRIYRVDPAGLDALRTDLERFWGQALAAYKVVVEQRTEEVS
jgi:DNA-binding transcriptional ArsR family regulator